MGGVRNILRLLLLIVSVGLVVLVENEAKTSVGTSVGPVSSTMATFQTTTPTSNSSNNTNSSTATSVTSAEVTTCSANDSSCSTVTERVDTTTASTVKNGLITTLKSSGKFKNGTKSPATIKAPTTVAPIETIPQIGPELLEDFDLDVCTCDLQRKFCDINCCCDEDCSFENKMVFNTCKKEVNLHRDTSFCQYMDYIYLNNTPYKWEVNQNGLFCIAKSNLPASYVLQKQELVASHEDVQLQKRNRHAWPDSANSLDIKFNSSEPFVFGSSLCIVKNKYLEPFQLPDSFVTNACVIKQSMKFLQNFKTRCSQTFISESNPSLDAETYFKNVSFVRAPRYLSESLPKKGVNNCTAKVCLPIEVKICDENFESCTNVSQNTKIRASCRRSIISNQHTCTNLTQAVKYNIYHNGTWGLTRVELFITLKNISYFFGEENFEFPQHFEANYVWSNYSHSYSSLKSGNPGYLISKPILIGNAEAVNITNSTAVKIFRSPSDITDNFLMLPANKKGLCVLNNHTHEALPFGYNMILKCTVKKVLDLKNLTASRACKQIQTAVLDFWPISRKNLSAINRVVGNFGNANASILADWGEILSDKTPAEILNRTLGNFTRENTALLCSNLVVDLGIDIFHARVDFKDLRNQEKILGVSYRFGTGRELEFALAGGKVNFEATIREEVMFFDITSERVQKFVDPPTFTITLPYDFFYPFVKVGNRGNSRFVCDFLIFSAVLLRPWI